MSQREEDMWHQMLCVRFRHESFLLLRGPQCPVKFNGQVHLWPYNYITQQCWCKFKKNNTATSDDEPTRWIFLYINKCIYRRCWACQSETDACLLGLLATHETEIQEPRGSLWMSLSFCTSAFGQTPLYQEGMRKRRITTEWQSQRNWCFHTVEKCC